MSKLQALGGLVLLLAAVALYAVSGAVSFGTAAAVISGTALLFGIISMGTAQAVFLWIIGAGAILGVFVGFVQIAILS